MSHVDNSFNDPKKFTLNNAFGTHVLLDKLRELKPGIEFIHFSTDEVYGESIKGNTIFRRYRCFKTNKSILGI